MKTLSLSLALSTLLLPQLQAQSWSFPELPEAAATPPTAVPQGADPRKYDDAEGFNRRSDAILQTLATEDLSRWRTGYFSGGDPGKYLPGAAMSRLILDDQDPEALEYMNDDRSPREHYHFAAVNMGRFYPLFGKSVFTEESEEAFKTAFHRFNYLHVGGTENHRTMWMTTANVLPAWLHTGSNFQGEEETLAEAKQQLKQYVKGLYMAGPGEWDSSTYAVYTINGLLNIYDFSPDPECRLLAQAGLDVMVAAYALKYTDGIFCGPNQRGHYPRPHQGYTDQTGFVWWGSSSDREDTPRGYRYALHAITSAWKPGPVLNHIAHKKLPTFPVEQNNSKPNYWYGQKIPPVPGATHETLWITPTLTMGSLWDGHSSQHTRFMISVARENGGISFTGGHPRRSDHNNKKVGLGFTDGISRYCQSAQVGDTYLSMALVPEDEEADYAFFSYPEACPPKTLGDWTCFEAGKNIIAVHALNGTPAELTEVPTGRKNKMLPIVKFPGRKTGFFVVVGGPELLEPETLAKRVPDLSRFASDMSISWTAGDGRRVSATFAPDPAGDLHGSRLLRASINDQAIDFPSWSIYGGPYVRQTPGLLEVTDGKDGFAVDFTGELPVYRAL